MATKVESTYIETRKEFRNQIGLCAATLTAIHLLPKADGFELLGFIFTTTYLGAVLWLLGRIAFGLMPFLTASYEYRYQDCGPAMESTWRLYLHSLDKAIRVPALALFAIASALTVRVMGLWISVVAPLDEYAGMILWAAVVVLIACPFVFRGLYSECMQRRNVLHESLKTSSFRPRAAAQVSQSAARSAEPAVISTAPWQFRAGGFDWSWQDFYKNGIVFGQAGTGKTVCVLNAVLDGWLASGDAACPPAGLILDPKGDYRSKVRELCRRYGREQDLVVIDPASPGESIRWNPFDSDDDVLQLAGRFAAVLQSVGMKAGQESFWVDSARKFICHALDLIRLTNPEGEPPSFAQIRALATSQKAVGERARRIADNDSRGDICLQYFAEEWACLANETRSSIQAHITNMVDPFVREPYATVFSGRSTVRMQDALARGKIVYVYMPVAEKEDMARTICTFIKLAFYREVLRSVNKQRPSFFLCDEFQSFFTTMQGFGDADFYERSRQSNHANLVATQNLPALLKQTDTEHPVHNLLGNCAVKLFLRNTDHQTNQYASELCGQDLVAMAGSSLSQGAASRTPGMQSSQSTSRQYDARFRPETFAELAVPDAASGVNYSETLMYLASRGTIVNQKLTWKVHPLQG